PPSHSQYTSARWRSGVAGHVGKFERASYGSTIVSGAAAAQNRHAAACDMRSNPIASTATISSATTVATTVIESGGRVPWVLPPNSTTSLRPYALTKPNIAAIPANHALRCPATATAYIV